MRNAVDACCAQCGDAFRWLCGTPVRCPNGHDLNPQPITWGQYVQEKASAGSPRKIQVWTLRPIDPTGVRGSGKPVTNDGYEGQATPKPNYE